MVIVVTLILLAGPRPGDVISVEAEMTYTVRATTAMVVRSPLWPRPVYAVNAVQRWRDPVTGEQRLWIDPCLPGMRVRWQRPDGVWTDGIVDRNLVIWRDGASQIRLDEQPQMRPATRRERAPWSLW